MRFKKYLNEKRGSTQTKLAETAQCIGIAIWQKKGSLSENDFTKDNINRVSKYFDIGGTSISKVLEFLDKNPSWVRSTINTIDSLVNSGILRPRGYIAHRDSKFISSIYNEFKRLKTPAQKIVGRIDNDKWNPGDIWLSLITNIPNFDNLAEYNQWIGKKFENRELIAVSLKKAPSPNPPVKIYNKINEWVPVNVEFKRISQVKHPFSTHSMTIQTSEDKIVARSFDAPKEQTIKLEIDGKEAAGGKANLGLVNYYLNQIIGETVIEKSEILNMTDEQRLKKMKDLYNSIGMGFDNSLYEEGFTKKTIESIEKYGDSYIRGWWISKIQSLDLCSKLVKNREKAHEIITYLYLYASSQGLPGIFNSSMFVKVGK